MRRLSLAALLVLTSCGSAPAREPAAPAPAEAAAPAPSPPAPAAKTAGDPPLPVAAPPANAIKTASGVAYTMLTEGSGASPTRNDTIATRGAGWHTDGTLLFEARGADETRGGPLWAMPAEIGEIVAMMKPGGRVMFWVPAKGDETQVRVFDLELVSVTPAVPAPADVAKPPKGAAAIGDGIRVLRVAKGKGAQKPMPSDTVVVKFSGWDRSGRTFDGDIPGPVEMAFLKKERPGIRTVLARMVVGEKVHAWIPGTLIATLDPPIEGDALYAIELTEIVAPPEGTPVVPRDVAAPPKGSKKTVAGVSHRVLTKGTGKVKPTADSTVTVHYTGWTTDGEMFDSSVTRGEPASFPLKAVIAGWRDAVQTMVVGQKSRFWIPAELAYGKEPRAGAPAGMLVFDIELLSIDVAEK